MVGTYNLYMYTILLYIISYNLYHGYKCRTVFKTLHDPYSEIRNLMKNGMYII